MNVKGILSLGHPGKSRNRAIPATGCVLCSQALSNPRAAFGEGFHPSSQLSTHSCSLLGQEMGSLDSAFWDPTIGDCTAKTCLKREVPQEVTWSCSCLFPDRWLVDLGFVWLLLGCAVLSLGSSCVSPQGRVLPGSSALHWWGQLPLSFLPCLRE